MVDVVQTKQQRDASRKAEGQQAPAAEARKEVKEAKTSKTQQETRRNQDVTREKTTRKPQHKTNHSHEHAHHRRELQEEQQIVQSKAVVAVMQSRLQAAIKSIVQRAIGAPRTPDEERLANLSKQSQAKGLAEHLAASKASGLEAIKTEQANILGQSQGMASRTSANEQTSAPGHVLVRRMMRDIQLGGEMTQASRDRQVDYKVWNDSRNSRPNIAALRAKGTSHEAIKQTMGAHVEMCVFMMLNIWSVYFRRLQKRFKEYEENTGEEATLIPRSFKEIVSQIRFARNLDVGKKLRKKRSEQEDEELAVKGKTTLPGAEEAKPKSEVVFAA